MLLVQTENLSRTLQDSEWTAIEFQDIAEKTVQTLKSKIRTGSFGVLKIQPFLEKEGAQKL